MNDFNYYPIKKKEKRSKSPFSLIDIIKIKEFNKNLYIRKILKSLEKEQKQKLKSTEKNNASPKNDNKNKIYNESSNKIDKKNNNEYKKYMTSTNSLFLTKRLNRNQINRASLQNTFFNNSFSTVNFYDKKIVNDYPSKLSEYIIKPYKKKTIIMNPNPYKNKNKKRNIKLDLLTPEINNKLNFCADSTFYKTKNSLENSNDSFNLINLKKINQDLNKLNKTIYERKENKIHFNGPLISIIENNGKIYTRNKFNLRYNNFNASKEKKKISGKTDKRKSNLRSSLTPDKYNYSKYKMKLSQILILFLEKYYKIHILKIKYSFFNILKKYIRYKKQQKIKVYQRNKDISSFYNYYNSTEGNIERNYVNKNEKNFYPIKYNSRKERILMFQIKSRNKSESPENKHESELCRNWSELKKKKEVMDRRKKSRSKSKKKLREKELNESDSKNKQLIYENSKLMINRSYINIMCENKPDDINIKRNYPNYDYKGKIVIVKKIYTKDRKINIDIKYRDFMNFENKTKFKNLKISKDFRIDLIRHSNKNVIIQRIGNKYYNNKTFERPDLNIKSNLALIKEEEERSNYDDKCYSKQSNEERCYKYN